MLEALKVLDNFFDVLEIDNRMKEPTALGWRDCAALVVVWIAPYDTAQGAGRLLGYVHNHTWSFNKTTRVSRPVLASVNYNDLLSPFSPRSQTG